jgi:NAD(P)-dependent dehydrogenase (short-subunit alcohol dehydrogenase family)
MTFSLRAQFDLTGRVALITGAANILGPEFAAALAEFGARLALLDIRSDACQEVAHQIHETYGTQTLALTADVGEESAVAAAVAEALSTFGRIDVLINAAATKTPDYFRPLGEYSLQDWNQVMTVNLTGMFLCTKHVLPHFVSRGQGNIINVASIYGVVGPDPRIYEGSWYLDQRINTPPVYAASKGGVVSLTRYLATTLAPHHIRANCVTPGGVSSGQNETFVERYSARVPLGRMARREELRGAVLFLASDASSYVTGHNLVVDGGWTAW